MKKALRVCIVFGTILFLIVSLCGCTSKEAKNVMEMIDSIGEVSVKSSLDIYHAQSAYDDLTPKQQKQVKNVDVLLSAQEKFKEFIPEYIKEYLTVYKLDAAIHSVNYNSLKSFVEEYNDYFDEEQKQIIGCAIGSCLLKDKVPEKVKSNLKNPDSFELVSFESKNERYDPEQELYRASVSITYRGTNSFGAVVTETLRGSAFYTVKLPECTINYLSTALI